MTKLVHSPTIYGDYGLQLGLTVHPLSNQVAHYIEGLEDALEFISECEKDSDIGMFAEGALEGLV